MKTLRLHLRQTPEPVREPAAWFIAGADAAAWLEEIFHWGVPQDKLRLFALPRSPDDRTVAGVLVVPPAGVTPRGPMRAIPFGVLAGRLYLPVDAELWPPVDPAELKLLHDVQVFHPGIGLVAFESAEALKISALLRPSPSRVENWNFARPGIGFNTRLRAVSVSTPLSDEELFGDAGKDIGSEPIMELPPAPDEPGESALDKLWRGANRKFAEILSSLSRQVPHTGSRRTWINDLEEWAAKRLSRLTAELEALRQKELNRLLHQLENDPESGLRHAIPLNQIGHRGVAPPGSRLGVRFPNFNLGRLRGGQAADFWDISPQLRQQLTARYRELANRELQLGRYRRAAYIFAELLGDLEAAASALKQGRHFREAAVIYRDHLRRPREAALCLAEGGLFSEAIAIYENESCFLDAADLYLRTGQPEKAAAACRQEVNKLLKHEDRVGAAKLIEERLALPDEALALLADGWPRSTQAVQCLEAHFAFLARHGLHAEGAALVERLRAEQTQTNLIPRLTALLAAQSATYPDRVVRHAAADVTRVKAGERLHLAEPAEAVRLSDALVKLAPEDRLLARDAVRFVAQTNEQFRRRMVTAPARKTSAPVIVRTFQLPQGFNWHTVKSCGSCFFAVGYGRHNLMALRGNWNGLVQATNWPCPDFSGMPLILELDDSVQQPASVTIIPGPLRPNLIRVPEQALASSNLFDYPVNTGTPGWIPDDLLAISHHRNLVWILREASPGLVLECRKRDGTIVSSNGQGGFVPPPGNPPPGFSLLVQGEMGWLAAGRQLFLLYRGKLLKEWDTENEALGLVGSAPLLKQCALVRMRFGAAVQWSEGFKDEVEVLCPELETPLATFTGNGTVVLLSNREGRICEVSRKGTSTTSFEFHDGRPVAVVRGQAADEFVIFTNTGQASIFRTSAGR